MKRPVLPIALFCTLTWLALASAFVALAQHAESGRISRHDLRLIERIHNLPSSFEPLYRAESWLGQPEVLALATLGLAAYLLLCRARLEAVVVLGAFVPFAVTIVVKHIVQETPPFLDHPARYHGVFASNFSFPSGHAVGFAVLGGLVIAFAERIVPDVAVATVLRIAAVIGIVTVGVARVYQLAHYPSDVAAGYILALLYLIPALLLYWAWTGRRRI